MLTRSLQDCVPQRRSISDKEAVEFGMALRCSILPGTYLSVDGRWVKGGG